MIGAVGITSKVDLMWRAIKSMVYKQQ